MMRLSAGLIVLLSLGGCAATADDYGGSPAAANTLAGCRAQSDMSPAMTNAQANPMFAAAQQQQFVNDCMAAKGYRLR